MTTSSSLGMEALLETGTRMGKGRVGWGERLPVLMMGGG